MCSNDSDHLLDRDLIPGGQAMDLLFLHKVCFEAADLVHEISSRGHPEAYPVYKVCRSKSHLVRWVGWEDRMASDGTLKKDTRAGYEYADNLLGLMAQVGFRRAGHSFEYETVATYSYLPDGTKLDVTKSDSSAVLYRGNFTYRRSASGEITLESIAAPEGIILATGGGTVWTPYTLVTDRLGSVRAIVDMSSGTVVERNDYYPYGKRITTPTSAAGTYPQLATNRWRFPGKEEQDSLAFTPYLDFGARQYDPEVASWLAPAPSPLR